MKQRTLRNSADFSRVLRTGRRARRDGVTAYAAALPQGSDETRVGLAVRCDRAVDRNLLKRRLREALRTYSPGPGFEVVLRADQAALSQKYQELENHVYTALLAVGLPVGEGR